MLAQVAIFNCQQGLHHNELHGTHPLPPLGVDRAVKTTMARVTGAKAV